MLFRSPVELCQKEDAWGAYLFHIVYTKACQGKDSQACGGDEAAFDRLALDTQKVQRESQVC